MILMHLVNLVILVNMFFSDETDNFGEPIESGDSSKSSDSSESGSSGESGDSGDSG